MQACFFFCLSSVYNYYIELLKYIRGEVYMVEWTHTYGGAQETSPFIFDDKPGHVTVIVNYGCYSESG